MQRTFASQTCPAKLRKPPTTKDERQIIAAFSYCAAAVGTTGGTPLPLSNLVGCAELRFQLEDAKDGKGAVARVDKMLTVQWSGNPTMQPKLELVSANNAF